MKLNLIQRVTAFSAVVAFVSVLSLIVLCFGYMQLQAAEDSTRLATATSRASVDAARGLGELLLTEGSKSSRELLKKSIDELNSGFVSIGTEGTETASSATKSWLSVKQSLEEMLAQKKPSATNDDSLILYGKLQSGFDELIGLLAKLQAESEESTHSKLVSTFSVLGVAFGAVMLLVIGSGVVTRISLIRSVGGDPTEVVTAVQQVARGNLSDHLSVRAGDTVSVLAETERMQLSLRTIVSDVRMRAEKLAVVSEQTVARATQLSVQSDLVSSELTESTQVVENLGASSASNFGYAKAAQASAQQASVKATQGGHAVARVVKTMENIHITSAKISDIISVIDSIAFQTNILALNAAVEAARAGEQGRGFAVVATEVRSLAQRSAKSAREIKGLIESSVLAVQNGQKEVTEAGASMNEIVTGVAETNSLIEMIFQSVSEQDKALQGLSGSVRNVASMNQENYQAVTEVSQVADKMQHNANRMMELVAHFKT